MKFMKKNKLSLRFYLNFYIYSFLLQFLDKLLLLYKLKRTIFFTLNSLLKSKIKIPDLRFGAIKMTLNGHVL